MKRQPMSDLSDYKAAGKLKDKIALITGGDSGVGRAVAITYAMEGADVAILYDRNDDDANHTRQMVEAKGRHYEVIRADVRSSAACRAAVEQTVEKFGKLDILINNAAFQATHSEFAEVTEEELRRTFETNIFGYFVMAQAALPHLTDGSAIINTGSIVGLIGHTLLIPCSSSKRAVLHAFTKALALNIGKRNIRVNTVIPGPIWTPNIPCTIPMEEIDTFRYETALKRPGQPEEVALLYVMLTASDSSYMTGSQIEVTGGVMSSR
jgi:NAD(P)-dependent dehydrogenase (short-subunit alcohol dehydrogenase family)